MSTYHRLSPDAVSCRRKFNTDFQYQLNNTHRERSTARIRRQASKVNPALQNYFKKREKTAGELLVEKFFIKDKEESASNGDSKTLQDSSTKLLSRRPQDILQRQATRRIMKKRLSADIQMSPRLRKHEMTIAKVQAKLLDNLVAEEQTKINSENKNTILKSKNIIKVPCQETAVSKNESNGNLTTVRNDILLNKSIECKEVVNKVLLPLKEISGELINTDKYNSQSIFSDSFSDSNVELGYDSRLSAKNIYLKLKNNEQVLDDLDEKQNLTDNLSNKPNLIPETSVIQLPSFIDQEKNTDIDKTFQSTNDVARFKAVETKDIIESNIEVRSRRGPNDQQCHQVECDAPLEKSIHMKSTVREENLILHIVTENPSNDLGDHSLRLTFNRHKKTAEKNFNEICEFPKKDTDSVSSSITKNELTNNKFPIPAENSSNDSGEIIKITNTVNKNNDTYQRDSTIDNISVSLIHPESKKQFSFSSEVTSTNVNRSENWQKEIKIANFCRSKIIHDTESDEIDRYKNFSDQASTLLIDSNTMNTYLNDTDVDLHDINSCSENNKAQHTIKRFDRNSASFIPIEYKLTANLNKLKESRTNLSRTLIFSKEKKLESQSFSSTTVQSLAGNNGIEPFIDDATLETRNTLEKKKSFENSQEQLVECRENRSSKSTLSNFTSTILDPSVQNESRENQLINLNKFIIESESESTENLDTFFIRNGEVPKKKNSCKLKIMESDVFNVSDEESRFNTRKIEENKKGIEFCEYELRKTLTLNQETQFDLSKTNKKPTEDLKLNNSTTDKKKTTQVGSYKSSDYSKFEEDRINKLSHIDSGLKKTSFLSEDNFFSSNDIIDDSKKLDLRSSKTSGPRLPTSKFSHNTFKDLNFSKVKSSSNNRNKSNDYSNVEISSKRDNFSSNNQLEEQIKNSDSIENMSNKSVKQLISQQKHVILRKKQKEKINFISSDTMDKRNLTNHPIITPAKVLTRNRPLDLMKMFYTTPASLLTATPRDLSKVKRVKVKRKKHVTRISHASHTSTESDRSTHHTEGAESILNNTAMEDKRNNTKVLSVASNDSGFDGSPILSSTFI